MFWEVIDPEKIGIINSLNSKKICYVEDVGHRQNFLETNTLLLAEYVFTSWSTGDN